MRNFLILSLCAIFALAEVTMKDINRVVNNSYKYIPEQGDKWLSYEEFKKQGGGDCEDFVIAKYTIATEIFGFDKKDFKFLIVQPREKHLIMLYKNRAYQNPNDINKFTTLYNMDYKAFERLKEIKK